MAQPAEPPRSFSGILAMAVASVIGSRAGRVVAALFAVFEIYNLTLAPLWQQAAELPRARANLESERAKAAAANDKEKGEADGFTAKAKLTLAEANAAVEKARSDADKMEAAATEAESGAAVSPEAQAALASKLVAAADKTTETARHAHDLAANDAAKLEAQAKEIRAEYDKVKLLATNAREKALQELRGDQRVLALHIGLPLPPALIFDPTRDR
jgi:hypothetical protein